MVGSVFLDEIDNGVCGDDSFDILNLLDFQEESLEGNGLGEDWQSNFQSLGPVSLEVLLGSHPVSRGNHGNDTFDMQPMSPILNDGTPMLNQQPNFITETSSGSTPLHNSSHDGRVFYVFQEPSPNSVLESSGSCSVETTMLISLDNLIPLSSQSKLPQASTSNPGLLMSPISSSVSASKKMKRKGRRKKLSQLSDAIEMKKELHHVSGVLETNETSLQQHATNQCTHCKTTDTPLWREGPTGPKTLCNACGAQYQSGCPFPEYHQAPRRTSYASSLKRKCMHCEVTNTTQWRQGPMGPKTLCNACGVRYRSGRLFPEYRPAASPTFVPSLHSNWHRKVIEMRNKSKQP